MAAPAPGKALTTVATEPCPSESPCMPLMYAATKVPTCVLSWPKVNCAPNQRGSVARSADGESASRMPMARYSLAAVFANFSTNAASHDAASACSLGH